jgi:hypothetical protein
MTTADLLAALRHTGRIAVLTLAVCALPHGLRAQELVPSAGSEAPAPDATAPAAATESAPAPQPLQPSAAAAAESTPASDSSSEATEPSVAAFSNGQIANLHVQLQQLESERANLWWPRLVVGAGLGASVLAAGVGAGHAFACDGECSTPPWVSLVVVVGAAVGVLGSIWLLRTEVDVARVELRKHHIEYELERWNQSALQRQRVRAEGPQLSVRFAL